MIVVCEPFLADADVQLTLTEPPVVRTRVERVPSDSHIPARLADLKRLGDHGWTVTALLAPDRRTVVLLACEEEGGER